MLEEYTLLLCADADCEGGETIFHLNKFFKHASRASVTPKQAVLFRKDITHEGALITRGYKEILTFNLWATRRDLGGIVAVTFEGHEGVYVMPKANVMNLPNNSLAGHIRFNGLEERAIVNIHFGGGEASASSSSCPSPLTYESFEIVYRVIMRMYVDVEKLDLQLLDYFNIEAKNVLLDVSPSPSELDEDAAKRWSPLYKAEAAKSAMLSLQEDILLTPSPEVMEYICHTCVAPNHLPYLPFLTVWIEGFYSYGGGMADTPALKFSMEPVFAAFSQANNLWKFVPLVTTGTPFFDSADTPFWSVFTNHGKEQVRQQLTQPRPVRLVEHYSKTGPEEGGALVLESDGWHWEGPRVHYGLEVACPELTTKTILDLLLLPPTDQHLLEGVLMGGLFPGTSFEGPHYNLDCEGKTYLTDTHFEAVINHISNARFFEKLKQKLAKNEVSLNFPQLGHSFEHNFCNEDVYGQLSLSLISGFVRMA
ncbi:hypothetical protein QOT17_011886 [Balamuthia mandrillaris]